MRRIILVAVVLAFTVPSLLIFTKHEAKEIASFSGSFMENVRVVNKGAGTDRWTLSAKKVEIPPDSRSSRLHAVTINVPEHNMDVVSDAGEYDLDSRDLRLTGNVEAATEGYLLKTDSIYLKSATNELSSDDRVVLEGNNFRIEGNGFHTIGEKKVTFNNNVKATFF